MKMTLTMNPFKLAVLGVDYGANMNPGIKTFYSLFRRPITLNYRLYFNLKLFNTW